jgi:hypothetical protein
MLICYRVAYCDTVGSEKGRETGCQRLYMLRRKKMRMNPGETATIGGLKTGIVTGLQLLVLIDETFLIIATRMSDLKKFCCQYSITRLPDAPY